MMNSKPLESHPNRYIRPSTRIFPRRTEALTDVEAEPSSTSRKRRYSDTQPYAAGLRRDTSPAGRQELAEETAKKLKITKDVDNEVARDGLAQSLATVMAATPQVTVRPRPQDHDITNNHPAGHDTISIYDEEGAKVFLHEVLAKNLRSHQIEGLRFLWRQVAVGSSPPEADCSGEDGDEHMYEEADTSGLGGGALLAHTMGLGKTVTVIAFLFTLAEAQGLIPVRTANLSLSYNLRVGQHMARILILVPGGLLTNWALELKTWAAKFPESSPEPPSCGRKLLTTVYRVGNNVNIEQRVATLTKWHASGGILLLGHELFRALVDPKETTYRSESLQTEIERCLLIPGPELVVADEAHAFKNTQSKITKAVNKISTRNRIALTASPLSNSLLEFYSLMSWVSPESELGETVTEFRETYYNPIMNGLTSGENDGAVDSLDSGDDTDERENAEIARKALEDIIKVSGGKVHRKNVDTIKQYLKPKTEFIVRIPLTDKQIMLYNNYLQESANDKSSSIWRLFCLRALCNHPDVFKKVLKRGIGKKREEGGWLPERKEEDLRETNYSSPLSDLPFRTSAEVVAKSEQVDEQNSVLVAIDTVESGEADNNTSYGMAPFEESQSLQLRAPKTSKTPLPTNRSKRGICTPDRARAMIKGSNKFIILFRLLEEFKALGDKALLFSHSIDTLNFLYTLAITLGFTVLRLDGTVHFQQRQEDLVQFNHGIYDIYLVSTKAGGVGLNLQCANRVIILDNDHSPVWEQQAIGRSYRMGQQKEVFVYRFLVEGSVETKISREKRIKVQLSDVVVDRIWEKRRAYGVGTDHRAVWEPACQVRVPSVIGNAGKWRGRDDLVLDKVVASVRVITDIRVDAYETTSTAPTTVDEDGDDIGTFLSDVEIDLKNAGNNDDGEDGGDGHA
ncbi:P-loop containing nucleoside triphosphate hydrolase protein [Terfezia claveryi]|nr:P-loop containing nucleoside triphosphate hydrolase protein [Terfezia claveryi]